MFAILEGSSEPEDTNRKTKKKKRANDDLLSILFLSTSGTAATVSEQHDVEEGKGLGNGQEAWKVLATKYNAYMREMRRSWYEKLTSFRTGARTRPRG